METDTVISFLFLAKFLFRDISPIDFSHFKSRLHIKCAKSVREKQKQRLMVVEMLQSHVKELFLHKETIRNFIMPSKVPSRSLTTSCEDEEASLPVMMSEH